MGGLPRRRDWRWVTRDGTPGGPPRCAEVHASLKEPAKSGNCWYSNGGTVVVCHDEFRKMFGVDVPTDKPIKVRFGTAEIIG